MINITVNSALPGVTATASQRADGGLEVEVYVKENPPIDMVALIQDVIGRDMARNGPITRGIGSKFDEPRAD